MQTLSPFDRIPILNGQLILGALEVLGNSWDLLQLEMPSLKGQEVQGVVDWVIFYIS